MDNKPLAVIVKGNPKYLRLPEVKPLAEKFYSNIYDNLTNKGYNVIFDEGKPYTLPDESAEVWVGHSRGSDRLDFAPNHIKTIYLQTNDTHHIHGVADHTGRDPAHYQLSAIDVEALDSLKPNKYLEKIASRATGVCDTPGAIYHSKFSGNDVGMTVTLPKGISVPVMEMDEVEWQMHDALERILAKYFKKHK